MPIFLSMLTLVSSLQFGDDVTHPKMHISNAIFKLYINLIKNISVISNTVEHAKKVQKSSYSVWKTVCFSSKKMFFIIFLKQFERKVLLDWI